MLPKITLTPLLSSIDTIFKAISVVVLSFFAPFFKFALELKYTHGLTNSFIQDYSPVAKPIDQLYNKGWWFSIIFES
jgi:hypothetical protein